MSAVMACYVCSSGGLALARRVAAALTNAPRPPLLLYPALRRHPLHLLTPSFPLHSVLIKLFVVFMPPAAFVRRTPALLTA